METQAEYDAMKADHEYRKLESDLATTKAALAAAEAERDALAVKLHRLDEEHKSALWAVVEEIDKRDAARAEAGRLREGLTEFIRRSTAFTGDGFMVHHNDFAALRRLVEGECWKCGGDGQYCWTCGERETGCECSDDDRNIGVCDECESAARAALAPREAT